MAQKGPNDAAGIVWALFPLRGPALAFVGRHGLLWACIGCCGPSSACVGLRLLCLLLVPPVLLLLLALVLPLPLLLVLVLVPLSCWLLAAVRPCVARHCRRCRCR